MNFFRLFLTISLGISYIAQCTADCQYDNLDSCCYRGNNQLYIGPEFYHVHRYKKSGSHQDGWVYGGKIGYDRLKRFGFYWGGEAYYAMGKLSGKTNDGTKLKSDFYDAEVEGRFGYTLQQADGFELAFTPYVGLGYLWETNNFKDPSPLKIHTQIKGGYVCGGFLSKATFCTYYNVGLNFKIKYLIDARNSVSHDPEFSDSASLVKNEYQYKIELPLEYNYRSWNFGFLPFYEFRHYGGRASFPFDFVETKLNIWGVFLKLTYIL